MVRERDREMDGLHLGFVVVPQCRNSLRPLMSMQSGGVMESTYSFELAAHEQDTCPNATLGAFLARHAVKVPFTVAEQHLRKPSQTTELVLVNLRS